MFPQRPLHKLNPGDLQMSLSVGAGMTQVSLIQSLPVLAVSASKFDFVTFIPHFQPNLALPERGKSSLIETHRLDLQRQLVGSTPAHCTAQAHLQDAPAQRVAVREHKVLPRRRSEALHEAMGQLASRNLLPTLLGEAHERRSGRLRVLRGMPSSATGSTIIRSG